MANHTTGTQRYNASEAMKKSQSKSKALRAKMGEKTKAFKKGRTSGNYGTHKEQEEMESKYRAMRKSRDK